jgi:hypothetical protein
MCLDMSMAASTGMEYWMELEIDELIEHKKDIDRLLRSGSK